MHRGQAMHNRMLGVAEMSYDIYQRPVGMLSRLRCSVDTLEEAEAMVADLTQSDLRFYNRFYWLKNMSAEECIEGDEQE